MTRLKLFKGDYRMDLRSNAGSESDDSGPEATSSGRVKSAENSPTLQVIDELENHNRAAKRLHKINLVRKKMTLPIKIPVALEPFFGAKPVSLRRSERLRARES